MMFRQVDGAGVDVGGEFPLHLRDRSDRLNKFSFFSSHGSFVNGSSEKDERVRAVLK